MSEQATPSPMPAIEDAVHAKLAGHAREKALNLIAFMQANGFSFEGFDTGAETGWTPTYQGNSIGCVMIPGLKEEFTFWLGPECTFDKGGPADDAFREAIWRHVVVCPQVTCTPPYCQEDPARWEIFGKAYESTCHAPLAFIDPDAETVENIKKLVLRAELRQP